MEPVIRARSAHTISRKNIDPDALKVLYRLHNRGYSAYLVGGGVRDMLIGRQPKDFDIATDAHPHEIKKLFRNTRLIGRRFRLAHIVFGQKIIEVSTFRKKAEFAEGDGDLLIRRDNTFGTAEEDALRRDFTVNGLFYDIATFSIIDYVGGLDDLDRKLIRTIGDPTIRFREDPIRILRAIKFAARTGFEIEPATRAAIVAERWEIPKSAAPRIVEEVLRMLRGGAARKSFQLLRELGVLEVILPRLHEFLGSSDEAVFPERTRLWEYLEALDDLRREGREFANPVLAGCLLWPPIRAGAFARGLDVDNPGHLEELLAPLATEMHLSRKDTERLKLVLSLQGRLAQLSQARGRVGAVVSRGHFPDALDLFEIGAMATGEGADLVPQWRDLAAGAPPSTPRRARRRRRRRAPLEAAEPVPGPEGSGAARGEAPR
jgi:poly(A) polymerase